MAFEKSAGVIVFRKLENGEIVYLLLRSTSGHMDFAKGNVEKGETEEQTTLREAEEETGLKDIVFLPGFKEKIKYFYRRRGIPINKEVVYFVGETKTAEVKLSWEHVGFEWLSYKESMEKIDFKNTKDVLKRANDFLEGGLGKFLKK